MKMSLSAFYQLIFLYQMPKNSKVSWVKMNFQQCFWLCCQLEFDRISLLPRCLPQCWEGREMIHITSSGQYRVFIVVEHLTIATQGFYEEWVANGMCVWL